MKTIMVINSKGGSGKTTIAVNIAAYYAHKGYEVTLVDLDPQKSSLDWLENRPTSKPKIKGTSSFTKPLKKRENMSVVYDVPAAVHGSRLETYIKKAQKIIVPVLPSPIDMKASKKFIQSLRNMGAVVRKKIKIGLVANKCRANTNIFLELDDYLVKERGMPYITAFRDNTNYIKSAKRGLGIFEFAESATAQDREEWKSLISWINSAKR
ncbi:MAG: ParA family protein [Pseudomonadota bacterium]|nr:ParA family protein [Pseudomonadota bacterium]